MLQLNEPVIRALVDRLTADLPATVAEINAGVTDGYLIDPPAQVLPMVPSIGLLTDWPTVAIQDLPTHLQDDIGSSATTVAELAIVCFLVDSDLQALGWKLRRYARALATVALAGRNLGDGAWGVTFRGTQPGPTLGDAEDPANVKTYTSWTSVVIRAKRDE